MTTPLYTPNQKCQVIFQPGQNQPRCTLLNSGTVTVYVDSIFQASTTQGFPLNVNATMPWDEHTPLYVICPSGTGQLQVLDLSLNYFDPYTLATAINLIGVPAIDRPTQLYGTIVSVPTGTTPASSPILDSTAYQSLVGLFSESGSTASRVDRVIEIRWYAQASGGNNLGADEFWLPVNGGAIFWSRPVRGPYFQVISTSAASVTTDSLTLIVYGSYRSQPNRTYLQSSNNNSGGSLQSGATSILGGIVAWSQNIAASGTFSENFNSYAGPATIEVFSPATLTANLQLQVVTYSGLILSTIVLTSASTPNQGVPRQFYIPARGIGFNVTNSDTTNARQIWGTITFGQASLS